MIAAVIFHSIQISDYSLIRFISDSVKHAIIYSLLLLPLHIEGHERSSRRLLDAILFHLLEEETDFRVSV